MIASDLLQQAAATVEAVGVGEAAVAQLRDAFPGVHFSYCLDDDVVNVEAAVQGRAFNLYLIDGRDHCLRLTTDAAAATGLLVAEVVQD